MRKEPDRNRATIGGTRKLMDRAPPGCLVTGYSSLIPSPVLPDPNDRHVLAAAIVGRCDEIVPGIRRTFPRKHSSLTELKPGILMNFCAVGLRSPLNCSAPPCEKIRARLKNPPFTSDDHLATLRRQGPVVTAEELEQFKDLL